MINVFAMLAARSFPPYPPALSTPAGAEREPNSRIWPRVFSEVLHALGQFVGALGTLQLMGVRTQLFLANVLSELTYTASTNNTGSSTQTSSNCPRACKTSVYSVGHIRLLAPLSAPAGVERGGGDRGGIKRQNFKHRLNQTAINRVLTPIIGGGAEK
jgi:hypothetical protein